MKRFVKITWIFYPLLLAALMYLLLPLFPDFTEYVISRGLFKLITVPIGFITSLLPFSLTELTVILALPLLIFAVVMLVVRLRKSSHKRQTVIKAARCVCGFVSFAALFYMICHGANYYRHTAAQLLQLDMTARTAEELEEVCIMLTEGAKQAETELTRDENGCAVLSEDLYTTLSRAGSGYNAIIKDYPWLWTSVWRQKPVMLSYLWSYTGITGMYFPFYAENNVNIEQPDYSIPFTAAHESAHSRGIAFEDECNFFAFLSCINSEYPEYRYAGYMQALLYCKNALYEADRQLWQAADSLMSDGMRADFAANNAYINKFKYTPPENPDDEPSVAQVWSAAGAINNTFITVQGVEDGSQSYARVVQLILSYYYTEGF